MDFEVGSNGEICHLPTPATEQEAEALCLDDNWVVEPKKDGIHVLTALSEVLNSQTPRVRSFSRKANIRYPHPRVIEDLLPLPVPTITDGEEMGDELVIFDLLQFDGEDLRQAPYGDRYRIAQDRVMPLVGPSVQLIEMVRGTTAKRDFITKMRAAGEEGVVFQDLRGLYTPGRPSGGGVYTARKLKFMKDADVIIGRRTEDQKASFEMYCLDAGELVNVGSVSARHFYPKLAPGAFTVATISYLYATPSRKLYQPKLVRFRDDKTQEECTIDQLQTGGRFAGVEP